ncbi:MAG: hypothetical protein OXO50_13380 [Caldilineaceae bacterium]|nr:hypothetical protein [Caldilineaceae bacterium]
MTISRCIFQCGNLLTKGNLTEEHVILNAIGGRRTVQGFICESCNNETGTKWDAELARQLQPLSLLLGIKRQRGRVKYREFPTSSGGKIRLDSDGKMTTAIPSHEKTTDRNTSQIRITAGSRKELKEQIKGMQRKHPALRKRSVGALLSTAQARSHYSSDLMQIPIEFGGDKTGRSLVKSAVALVHNAGVDPGVCDLALDYLMQDNAQPCFGYFYDKDKDLVLNRPVKNPFHCVYVKGDSGAGTILGYVEFFSLHRMILCLSRSFSGRDFTHSYAIDPIKGEELSIDIDLNLSIPDIRSALDCEKWDFGVWKCAIDSLLGCIGDIDFTRARSRAIGVAVERAFENCDAEQGEDLTEEQLYQLTAEITEELRPFILHNFARFINAPKIG